MTDEYDFDNYKRFPIMLSDHTAIIVHVLSSTAKIDDIFLLDFKTKYVENFKDYKKAAQQFFAQLEGHYCDMFVEELRDECDRLLKKRGKG